MSNMDSDGNWTPHDDGFPTPPFTEDVRVHVRKDFTWWPKRDLKEQRWILGDCYRSQFGDWLHSETVAFKVLEGKYRVMT